MWFIWMESKSVESDMINNVFRFVFRRKNKQRRRFANTRTGNVQLTVRKIGKFEINPTDFQRLAWQFIDCHRKSQSNGQLNPLELEWKISWNNRNSWDKDFISFEFALDDRRWITLFISFLTDNRVPLHNFGWFRFCNMIMIDPTFSCKLCGGVPGTSSEFKNSVG